ncbi:MAG: RNA methyltransferase [Candidatus Bathyarchaeia archaeon]
MTPSRRRSRLSVAVPASLVAEYANLRDKTEVIGRLARSAAIFRAEEIVIYPDQPEESALIKLILGYVETPQYLRKHLYNVRPELQYAGTLPPLRTPHHQLEANAANLRVGEFREGVLLDQQGVNVVDIGVEKPIRFVGKSPSRGSRVTVKIVEAGPEPRCEMARRADIPTYWGFEIQASRRPLGELASGGFYDLTIATSRTGAPISSEEERLKAKLAGAHNVLVAFGSPRAGIQEMLRREHRDVADCFQFNLNTIPEQGTETVRTEEAVHATLAVLNLH